VCRFYYMRVTVSHQKSQAEAIRAVDRAMEDVFQGLASGPITIADSQRAWAGSILSFSLTAKMGLIRNPIKGTIEVTDRVVILDADFGMFNLILGDKVRATVESRVRGLLT